MIIVERHRCLDNCWSRAIPPSLPLTPINVVAGNPSFNGTVSYTGSVDSHIDIVSVALKYRWDEPAPKTKMITK